MEYVLNSLHDLQRYAAHFLSSVEPLQEMATVIGLCGDLGSGKTAFVKEVAHCLKISEEILSPTYVLVKYYDIPQPSSWERLIHVDAYRMEDANEARTIRFDEIVKEPKNLVFVEWPEKIGKFFPRDSIILRFSFINETTRKVVE